jgi:hypothetical protein
MACFTHYWEGNTCDFMYADGHEGQPLNHTAGKLFRQRGIGVGDKLYVVNVLKGVLFLIGRLEVEKIASQAEAERLLGTDLWEAPEHLIAKPGTGTPMHFRRKVSPEITKELLFHGAREIRPLKFASEDELDRQTLRGIRRITEGSAHLLDDLLR